MHVIITATVISKYTTAAQPLYSNVTEDPDFSKEIITDCLLTITSSLKANKTNNGPNQ